MAEPVSWFLIEKRWGVVGSDGEEIGKVEEVVGDSNAGIFSGLAVGTGLVHRPRLVPSELVSEIVEGRFGSRSPRTSRAARGVRGPPRKQFKRLSRSPR